MTKMTKTLLAVAGILVLLGCVIFVSAMSMLQWDFAKLSTDRYETNEHVLGTQYDNVSVITDAADVIFLPSEDGRTTVVCYERATERHTVSVVANTLTIHLENEKKWYEYIGINLGKPEITVHIPTWIYDKLSVQTDTGDVVIPEEFRFDGVDIACSTGNVTCCASQTGDVRIKASTGDITVENILARSMELSVSTGKVSVTNVACVGNVDICVSTGRTVLDGLSCKNLYSTGSTGNLSMKNVIVEKTSSINRSTGDVNFDGCDAAEITIKTDTGHVKGSLLSSKIFIVDTDTGEIVVPKSTTGGKCEVSTDTGDIKIDFTP